MYTMKKGKYVLKKVIKMFHIISKACSDSYCFAINILFLNFVVPILSGSFQSQIVMMPEIDICGDHGY